MRIRSVLTAAVLAAAAILQPVAVRADIAPPRTPPGTTLLPGTEVTQVRMLAETVTLAISPDPSDAQGAVARTQASFTMRNTGASEERMQARFPLSFFDGSSDGWSEYPEIPSIAVKVDGRAVPTRREMQPSFSASGAYGARPEIPWAVFEVTFPPSQDVIVEVTYTARGYGYYPQATFDYILETGAAWNGTIGSVDVIVQLPYEASEMNVLVHESEVASVSTPGSALNGTEVRWRYENLEPTPDDNIEVILITPALWETVIKETEAVTRNPRDGEAWGRLAKAYKEATRLEKGWPRDDPAGREMLGLSEGAYQKCLALLPKDPLWHYGYADLLWSEYYWNIHASRRQDAQGYLPRALEELQTSLTLDPGNTLAQDLLTEIRFAVDGAVALDGDTYVFLALTATPPPPTPFPDLETATPEPSATVASTEPAHPPISPSSTPPTARNPLCAGAALSLGLPAALILMHRRRGGSL